MKNHKINIEILTSILVYLFSNASLSYCQSSLNIGLSQLKTDDWLQGQYLSYEVNYSHSIKKTWNVNSLSLGFTNRVSLGFKLEKDSDQEGEIFYPTDNDIFTELMVKYSAGWFLDPFFSVSFQTQMVESARASMGKLTPTARFWDPVTSLENWGLAYKTQANQNYFMGKISFSLKQIRSHDFCGMTDDYKTNDVIEKYKYGSGIQLAFESSLMIDSSTTYTGSLDIFGTFEDLSTQTVQWKNQVQVKIWKIFGIIIKADLVYDESQLKRVQYKESTKLGIVVSL